MGGVGPGDGAAFAWTSLIARGSHKHLVVALEASPPLKPVQKINLALIEQAELMNFGVLCKLTLGVPGRDWLGPGIPVTSGIRGGCPAPAPLTYGLPYENSEMTEENKL